MAEKSLHQKGELQLSVCLDESSMDALLDLFMLLDEWERDIGTDATLYCL
jgi:hypothetical protein